MDFDPTLGLDTPENVTLQVPLAGVGSRILAYLVDLALRVAVFLALAILMVLTSAWAFFESLSGFALAMLVLAFFLLQNAYFIVYEAASNGQTPGKRTLGIRVVRADGLPVTIYEAAVRNILRPLDLMPGFYLTGLVGIFVSSRCQRLGDLAAGTIVVKDRPIGLEELLESSRGKTRRAPTGRFVEERRKAWARLEELLAAAERRGLRQFDANRLEELARHYRRAASDLAYARSFFPGHPVVSYLNPLAARAHHLVYQGPRARLSRFIAFYRDTVPRTMRAQSRTVAWSAAVFLVSLLYGFILTTDAPAVAELFLPQEAIENLSRGKLWTDGVLAVIPSSVASAGLLSNNIGVTLTAFAAGLLLGLGSIYILALNGLMLGSVLAICRAHGMLAGILAFVSGHGFIELSAIVLSGAAGMVLGAAILHPEPYTRRVSLAVRGRDGVTMVLGMAPVLVVAGLVEGYISPREDIAFAWKLATGLALWLGLIAWLAFSGRGAEGITASPSVSRPNSSR